MIGGQVQPTPEEKRWHRLPELSPDVFAVLRKPNRTINPVTLVATVDPDGTSRTAPFGSLRAVTPQLLRLACNHNHDTYANLSRWTRECCLAIGVKIMFWGLAPSYKREKLIKSTNLYLNIYSPAEHRGEHSEARQAGQGTDGHS